MTQAHSRVWATQVDSVIREYVNARINEELKPIRDDVAAVRSALSVMRQGSQSDIGQLTARVNDVEALIRMSASRVAKLQKLAGKE